VLRQCYGSATAVTEVLYLAMHQKGMKTKKMAKLIFENSGTGWNSVYVSV